jgi:hypothetical protein
LYKDVEKNKIDLVSEILYPSDAPCSLKPLQCYGDGNCFYRSISTILFGTKEYHIECRVRTSLELVLNQKTYLNDKDLQDMSSSTIDNLLDHIIQTSASTTVANNTVLYQREVMKTTELGTYSSILHIYAACNAFGFKIRSIFPEISNVAVNRNLLNQIIKPLKPHTNDEICIM